MWSVHVLTPLLIYLPTLSLSLSTLCLLLSLLLLLLVLESLECVCVLSIESLWLLLCCPLQHTSIRRCSKRQRVVGGGRRVRSCRRLCCSTRLVL